MERLPKNCFVFLKHRNAIEHHKQTNIFTNPCSFFTSCLQVVFVNTGPENHDKRLCHSPGFGFFHVLISLLFVVCVWLFLGGAGQPDVVCCLSLGGGIPSGTIPVLAVGAMINLSPEGNPKLLLVQAVSGEPMFWGANRHGLGFSRLVPIQNDKTKETSSLNLKGLPQTQGLATKGPTSPA